MIFLRPHGGYIARASWKLCSISGAQTPSASPPETSLSSSNSLESYLAICCESSPGSPGILIASLPCMLYWAGCGDLELVFCSMSEVLAVVEPAQEERPVLSARGWGAGPHSRLGTDREILRLWGPSGGLKARAATQFCYCLIFWRERWWRRIMMMTGPGKKVWNEVDKARVMIAQCGPLLCIHNYSFGLVIKWLSKAGPAGAGETLFGF